MRDFLKDNLALLSHKSPELCSLIKDYDDLCFTKQGVHANWELLYFSAINKQ